MELGKAGLFRFGAALSGELAAAVERIGYGTVWIGGSPAADLAGAEELLDATSTLKVASGIVNIWTAPAEEVADSFHRLEAAHPDRFLLGIGIGHREVRGETALTPFAALQDYLDVLDAREVPAHRRVIAALGPRTLRLAAERSIGTHPYLTTPVHTRYARELLGEGVLIAPEQRLIPDTDAIAAREIGRKFLSRYLALENYRGTLLKHGFAATDLADGATDATVDALTPHGTAAELAAVVQGHLDAGADHVCVQVLPASHDPLLTLKALAAELQLGG